MLNHVRRGANLEAKSEQPGPVLNYDEGVGGSGFVVGPDEGDPSFVWGDVTVLNHPEGRTYLHA